MDLHNLSIQSTITLFYLDIWNMMFNRRLATELQVKKLSRLKNWKLISEEYVQRQGGSNEAFFFDAG